jgi:hypothetical protein
LYQPLNFTLRALHLIGIHGRSGAFGFGCLRVFGGAHVRGGGGVGSSRGEATSATPVAGQRDEESGKRGDESADPVSLSRCLPIRFVGPGRDARQGVPGRRRYFNVPQSRGNSAYATGPEWGEIGSGSRWAGAEKTRLTVTIARFRWLWTGMAAEC